MSDLMVDFIMSLDGYGAAEGWPGFWGMEGPEYLAWIGDDEAEEHDALMGATTYRLMSGFAAQMPDDPGLAGLTALPKVVFSSTLEAPLSWANSELVSRRRRRGGARDEGPGTRARCGRSAASACAVRSSRPAWSTASAWSSSRSSPAPRGRTASSTPTPTSPSTWSSNRTFDGRLQLLEYVPTVLDGPPGDGGLRSHDRGDPGPGRRPAVRGDLRASPATRRILLISGAAESMDGWDPAWCEQLAAAGRRVVRYDHRDSGRSTSSPPGHPSYPGSALTGDVLRILDALDVDRAHLVGLSMGGGIAQEVAARHPDRVATLTLVATSPAGRRQDESPLPPPEPRVAETFGNPPPEPDWTDREAVVDHLVESYRPYAGSLGFDEPAARRLVEHVVGRTVDIEAASKNHWLVAGDDEDDGFAMTDIVAPTLVIHGTTDPMFPLAHGEALAREIGDATLLRVPGMGHERPPVAVRAQATEAILRHTRPRPLDDDHGGEHQQPAQQLPG